MLLRQFRRIVFSEAIDRLKQKEESLEEIFVRFTQGQEIPAPSPPDS